MPLSNQAQKVESRPKRKRKRLPPRKLQQRKKPRHPQPLTKYSKSSEDQRKVSVPTLMKKTGYETRKSGILFPGHLDRARSRERAEGDLCGGLVPYRKHIVKFPVNKEPHSPILFLLSENKVPLFKAMLEQVPGDSNVLTAVFG